MKVIICGAGQVGSTIARYLLSDNNDVTIIDNSSELIEKISSNLDVQTVLGHASHPKVLERAGARDADMLIAVTNTDEINMVSCQVAHSLFNVPVKIARIRSQDYLQPLWASLYDDDNMPVDVIISPEVEIAKAVIRKLEIPGAIEVIPLVDDKVRLISVRCSDECPVINTPMRQISNLFPDLNMVIVGIIRDNKPILPKADEQIKKDDEVYFVVDSKQTERAMSTFGCEAAEARRILIFGGGGVGFCMAKELEKKSNNLYCKVIEIDSDRAKMIAAELEEAVVINGDALESDILQEAGIYSSEATIAVTNDDEVNLLSSLLAKRFGVPRTATLINNPTYNSLIHNLGVDTVIDPRAITVSTILQKVRKGRIHSAYSIHEGFGEIIEADALETSPLIGKPLRDIRFPPGVMLGAIVRDDQVINPTGLTEIEVGDRIVVFAATGSVKNVEKFFSVGLEYF
ncbi:MAG: Trk system potassium transporter TrkA [Alphaproteobacteria bacterium]